MFLYTNFMSETYYGLIAFILSTANIMMPLMAFGVHNTLVKFYSSYKTRNNLNSFLTLILFLPLLLRHTFKVMHFELSIIGLG